MIQLQQLGSNSTEIASAIMKAINSAGVETTVLALLKDKSAKKKIDRLKVELKTKDAINFSLYEKIGRKKIPRYSVVIDLKNKEVEVNPLPQEINLEFSEWKTL